MVEPDTAADDASPQTQLQIRIPSNTPQLPERSRRKVEVEEEEEEEEEEGVLHLPASCSAHSIPQVRGHHHAGEEEEPS